MDVFLKFWPVILVILQVFVALIIWGLHGNYAKKKHVEELDKRVSVVEETIDATGIKKAVAEIHEVKGQLDGLSTLINQVNNNVSMLLENELQQKREK